MIKLDELNSAVKAIDAIESHSHPRRVIKEFANYAGTFGFKTIAVAQLANPAIVKEGSAIRISNWPKDWVSYWLKNRLLVSDPIAKMASLQNKPFKWSEAFERYKTYSKAQISTLTEFGLAEGLTIPVHTGDGPPGCVSLGGDHLDLDPSQRASIELAAIHCYVQLEKLYGLSKPIIVRNLTHRESEILHFVAAGKTNWEIGQILSISQYHVRDCLKSIFRKLNTVSRAHTVATAIREKIIYP